MGKIVDGVYISSKGEPAHRGVVRVDGKLYYAGKDGVLVRNGEKRIHHGMANGLVHHGTYSFDADGVLDPESFKRPKKKRDYARELKHFLKNTRKPVLCAAAVLGLALVTLGVLRDRAGYTESTEASGTAEAAGLSLSVPGFSEPAALVTDGLLKVYAGKLTLQQLADAGGTAYRPLVFEYSLSGASSATLELYREGSPTAERSLALDVSASSVTVDNLYTGAAYRYKVTAQGENGQTQTREGSFETAATGRFISLPGVYNTRDIGGYDTLYGKKVKQGLVIRGTELDGLVQSSYFLTDAAAAEPFGFRYDFDLRDSSIFNASYVSPLGKDVVHCFHTTPQYGAIFSEAYETCLKDIFADLADAEHYPMYLHCTYGADRTGTVVFLLQGLLGVSEEDMLFEYELTGLFSRSYASGDNMKPVIAALQGVEGSTINEKIERFLLESVGVTAEQIASIREIFLEK